MTKRSSLFKQLTKSYELIWNSKNSIDIDLGSKPYLDPLYADILKSTEFIKLFNKKKLCIVDLGAGKGSRLVSKFIEFSPNIYAVDCFPSFLDINLRYNAKKILSDVLNTTLPDNFADLVVSAYVATNNPYFQNIDFQSQYANEILRILKPGGIFWGEEKDIDKNVFANHGLVQNYSYLNNYYVHYLNKNMNT